MTFQYAKHQFSFVALYCTAGEMRNISVFHFRSNLYFVSQVSQTGTEYDAGSRPEIRARSDVRYGFLYLLVQVHS
jgi:hypothetical protein